MTEEAARESARQLSSYPQTHCQWCVVKLGGKYHVIGAPYVQDLEVTATFRDGKEVTCPS